MNHEGYLPIVGHLGKNPEIKMVGEDNHTLCKFSVAVNYGKQDNRKTEWFNVVCWHDVARGCATLKKGDSVILLGKIRQREYQGKYYTDLVAEFVGRVLAIKKEKLDQQATEEPDPEPPEEDVSF